VGSAQPAARTQARIIAPDTDGQLPVPTNRSRNLVLAADEDDLAFERTREVNGAARGHEKRFSSRVVTA
jgi:hypothetical protein